MYNVLIVDDERLIQELFASYINASENYHLIDVLSDASNVEIMCSRQTVDLILMDVCTAHNSSGLEAAARIKEKYPKIKIIIVTSAPEYRFIEKARAANADGFWYKDSTQTVLLDIMNRIMAGEHIYPKKTPAVEIGLAQSSEFTPKELEVLLHLTEGVSSRVIAERMGISANGVNEHIKHLKEKTGCTSKTQLAVYASRTKLVIPEY